MTAARRFYTDEVREFVCDLRVARVDLEEIASRVRVRWPETCGHFTEQSARVLARYAPRVREKAKLLEREAREFRTCVYRYLEAGALSVCGCAGHPYCSAHKRKVLEAPNGRRYERAEFVFGGD